tara:strand:- start:68011 stop:70113 length:2103 start_codon:yes stop_codon:yes gene_type:complete
MKVLAYCPLNSDNIGSSLGTADYSYYFVMQRFLPLLATVGEVEILSEPPDDELVARYQQDDEVIYFAFTPPDKAIGTSLCPVVPVFAWEYSTIPDEAFKYPRDNWVEDLRASGQAITHSSFTARVVRAQLGQDYPIANIPAPLWDACAELRQRRNGIGTGSLDGLALNCKVIDSNNYDITNTSVRPKGGSAGERARSLAASWNGEPLTFSFARGEPGPTLVGFNDAEPWGVWSRSGHPWLMLEQAIEGEIEIEVTVRGYAHNIGEALGIELGDCIAYLPLADGLQTHVLRMRVASAANFLAFKGVSKRAVGMDDPRDIGFGLASIKLRRAAPEESANASVVLEFSTGELEFTGFHAPEAAGAWTSASHATIYMPQPVAGDLNIRLELFHLVHNDSRELEFQLGDARETVTLNAKQSIYELRLPAVYPTNLLQLDNIGLGPSGTDGDLRQIGLGISRITISQVSGSYRPLVSKTLAATSRALGRLRLNEILYTAILNPNDGRKNWEDIITAFVYALRDKPGATLLVKIANENLNMFFEDIFTFFMRLHPFECRVVFIHGYLSDQEYQQIILHSQFIVNASRGEGQCLPLMEFMSSGVPAIAPRNTAMLDYIDESNAFVVESSPELAYWPHDPRQVYRTYWHRINWQTLYAAFVDSEKCFSQSPRAYRKMCSAAVESLRSFCSMAVARDRLRVFIDDMGKRG